MNLNNVDLNKLKDQLYNYYIVENHSRIETANYFNYSEDQLKKILHQLQIPHKTKQQAYKNSEKTCLKKYGVKNCMQSQMLKDAGIIPPSRFLDPDVQKQNQQKIIEKYGGVARGSKTIREKIDKTMVQRYGTTCPLSNSEIKKSVNFYDLAQKVVKTKADRGTFNKSKPEEKVFEVLKLYYPDIMRQYTDCRYPWRCDFYIPSQDLFIEYNGHWTHGKQPFDKSNPSHIQRKQELTQRAENSKYYKIALNVWTKFDVQKLQCAKKNNLNYLVFYNYTQFKNWIEQKGGD